MKTKTQLEIGQKVKVLRNITEHGFDIGEIVSYIGFNSEDGDPIMMFWNGGKYEYSMSEEEFTTNLELINWDELEYKWEESAEFTGSSAFEWFKTEITKRLNQTP